MHLDAGFLSVPDRAMREAVHVEIAAQFPVHPHEQVAIERGGHAQRVVVGQQQLGLRLHEIGAEQQRVAGSEDRADAAQKRVGARRIEVADVRSEEHHERPAAPTRSA